MGPNMLTLFKLVYFCDIIDVKGKINISAKCSFSSLSFDSVYKPKISTQTQ